MCLQVDWETLWRERLADYARPQEVKSALGWSTKVTVEVRPAAEAGATAAARRRRQQQQQQLLLLQQQQQQSSNIGPTAAQHLLRWLLQLLLGVGRRWVQ
jgi:hypothetical protein